MMNKLKNYLELIRLPGMFTAHADILAAFLITGAGLSHIRTLIFILLASSCLFSAGMALNDYFDVQTDLMERPNRPIPSGRISKLSALCLGIGLIFSGILFAFLAGTGPFYISLALSVSILLYDGVLKDFPIAGPLVMASCRYFNFLMGLSILPFHGWVWIPFITGIYIFAVTILSQKEAIGGKFLANIAGCAAGVGFTALWYYFLYLKQVVPQFLGVFLMMLFAVGLSCRILNLLSENTPKDYQKTMKQLLLSIIIIDVMIASGFVPVYIAATILLLYLPAFFSVKLFKVT